VGCIASQVNKAAAHLGLRVRLRAALGSGRLRWLRGLL
jgi:hypothetical protein